MIYEGFKIHSYEKIQDAYCTHHKCRKKKPELMEVSNGFISRALFCPDCKSVYILKLERVTSTISKEFMQQCLDDLEFEKRKQILIGEIVLEKEHRREVEYQARMTKEDERLAKRKANKHKK